MKRALFISSFSALLLLTGCAPSMQNIGISSKSTKVSTNKAHTKADYLKIYNKLVEENKTKDLLWTYRAGTVANWVAKYPQSINYFDDSEKLIKKYDQEILLGKLLANVGSLLTNDTFMDYRPKIYEKIMVNTYKGIDFIALGDRQNARIELNRALVRQQRAKEFFKKEIAAERKKLFSKKDKKNKKGASFTQQALKNKKTMDPIEKRYSNLFAFKAYPDFVNPFTTYLAGLYFLNVKDYRKATNLLKESYGMIKGLNNGDRYVLQDFKYAFNAKRSLRSRNRHYTWVIFFNGEGPIKKEIKIQIPLFLVSRKVYYTGIALPTLKMRHRAYDYLLAKTTGKAYPTKTVASMDTVIKTEFKKRFPTIVTRALLRTITQTVIQKQLNDKGGLVGGLIGSLYQATMNRADTRMWEELPKEFQVVRLNSGKRVTIYTPSRKLLTTLSTSPNKNYLVFVTIRKAGDEPIVSYQSF